MAPMPDILAALVWISELFGHDSSQQVADDQWHCLVAWQVDSMNLVRCRSKDRPMENINGSYTTYPARRPTGAPFDAEPKRYNGSFDHQSPLMKAD